MNSESCVKPYRKGSYFCGWRFSCTNCLKAFTTSFGWMRCIISVDRNTTLIIIEIDFFSYFSIYHTLKKIVLIPLIAISLLLHVILQCKSCFFSQSCLRNTIVTGIQTWLIKEDHPTCDWSIIIFIQLIYSFFTLPHSNHEQHSSMLSIYKSHILNSLWWRAKTWNA